MGWKFYGYDKCSTCRKAAQFLEKRGVEFESIDITTHPPSRGELAAAAAHLGVKKLFNTSGLVYRELELGKRLPGMTEPEMLKLLASNGRLVKRPFLVGPRVTLVGFQEAQWKSLR